MTFLAVVVSLIFCLSWLHVGLAEDNAPLIDRVELATDGLKWHVFSGSVRTHTFHLFEDQCLCLDETPGFFWFYSSPPQRLCYCKEQVKDKEERFFARCKTNMLGEEACEATGTVEQERSLLGSLHLTHDDLIVGLNDVEPLVSSSKQLVKQLSKGYSRRFVLKKTTHQEKTLIEVKKNSKDLAVVARIIITGQGSSLSEADGADIWRFSYDISMDHLLLIAAHNIVTYAKNRNAFQAWMLVTSKKLVISVASPHSTRALGHWLLSQAGDWTLFRLFSKLTSPLNSAKHR